MRNNHDQIAFREQTFGPIEREQSRIPVVFAKRGVYPSAAREDLHNVLAGYKAFANPQNPTERNVDANNGNLSDQLEYRTALPGTLNPGTAATSVLLDENLNVFKNALTSKYGRIRNLDQRLQALQISNHQEVANLIGELNAIDRGNQMGAQLLLPYLVIKEKTNNPYPIQDTDTAADIQRKTAQKNKEFSQAMQHHKNEINKQLQMAQPPLRPRPMRIKNNGIEYATKYVSDVYTEAAKLDSNFRLQKALLSEFSQQTTEQLRRARDLQPQHDQLNAQKENAQVQLDSIYDSVDEGPKRDALKWAAKRDTLNKIYEQNPTFPNQEAIRTHDAQQPANYDAYVNTANPNDSISVSLRKATPHILKAASAEVRQQQLAEKQPKILNAKLHQVETRASKAIKEMYSDQNGFSQQDRNNAAIYVQFLFLKRVLRDQDPNNPNPDNTTAFNNLIRQHPEAVNFSDFADSQSPDYDDYQHYLTLKRACENPNATPQEMANAQNTLHQFLGDRTHPHRDLFYELLNKVDPTINEGVALELQLQQGSAFDRDRVTETPEYRLAQASLAYEETLTGLQSQLNNMQNPTPTFLKNLQSQAAQAKAQYEKTVQEIHKETGSAELLDQVSRPLNALRDNDNAGNKESARLPVLDVNKYQLDGDLPPVLTEINNLTNEVNKLLEEREALEAQLTAHPSMAKTLAPEITQNTEKLDRTMATLAEKTRVAQKNGYLATHPDIAEWSRKASALHQATNRIAFFENQASSAVHYHNGLLGALYRQLTKNNNKQPLINPDRQYQPEAVESMRKDIAISYSVQIKPYVWVIKEHKASIKQADGSTKRENIHFTAKEHGEIFDEFCQSHDLEGPMAPKVVRKSDHQIEIEWPNKEMKQEWLKHTEKRYTEKREKELNVKQQQHEAEVDVNRPNDPNAIIAAPPPVVPGMGAGA